MKSAVAYIYEQPKMQVLQRPFEIFTLMAEIPRTISLSFDKMRYPRYKEETVDLVGRLQEAGATGMIFHLPQDSSTKCWTGSGGSRMRSSLYRT
ncbi:MAG: hypothetical protein IPI06_15960 [Gammaproteobacteria bacterium]|nr:hypothetical protein [Gammaproteobacteria bacterium]